MAYVSIIINQSGKPLGEAGVSRSDLSTGSIITLTNDEPGNAGATSWEWKMLSWPKATPTEESPELIDSDTNTCQFIPTRVGTYIIQLVINDKIRGTIGAAIKTTNLIKRLPGERETNEYPGGWGYVLLDLLKDLEENSGSGGGGGGVGRYLVFSDDTEFTETGAVADIKKTFRIVIDSDEAPLYWRAVISMWITDAPDIAICEVSIGRDTFVMATTSATETVLSVTSDLITEASDTLLTATISIYLGSGSGATAHIKYTDIYAIFGSAAPE